MRRQRSEKPKTRFAITTDPHNFIVNEVKVFGEDAKTPGETYLQPRWYYRHLNDALEGMVRRGQLLDIGEQPTNLLAAIEAQKEEIAAVVEEYKAWTLAKNEAEKTAQALKALNAAPSARARQRA